MRNAELEAWVLGLAALVAAGNKVEDARVELKRGWLPAERAARRLAGHANASGGEPILWIIGIDEKEGVVQYQQAELAHWLSSVARQFDELMPECLSLVVSTADGPVTALLFDTSRLPYVVRNPQFGKPDGGAVEWEAPYREGTAVGSARRRHLIQMLVPMAHKPDVEALWARVEAVRQLRDPALLEWTIEASLYVTPRSDIRLVLPCHRVRLHLQLTAGERLWFECPRFVASTLRHGRVTGEGSFTVGSTETEAVFSGPGEVRLLGVTVAPCPQQLPHDISIAFAFAADARGPETKATISLSLFEHHDGLRWTWKYLPEPRG